METPPPRRVITELPGPRSREWMARGAFDMQAGYRALVVDDAASRGTTLVDVDGNAFLDLFSSFALGALGYNHQALLAVAGSDAFARAAANPTSTPFLTTASWMEFMEALEGRYAPRGLDRVFCVDGGGEGVESALKVAFMALLGRRRAAAGEPADPLQQSPEALARVMDNAGTDAVAVSFAGAFHGRGFGSLSATHSKPIHKADLPAFPWPTAPFPANRFPRARFADENARAEEDALRALDEVLDRHAGRVAAVLVEPIQSEGGDRHASAAFFHGVQRRARDAEAAFALDEVQTGVGITGSLWAHESWSLPEPPDLVAFGKKMQLGGFFARGAYAVGQFGRMYQTRNGDRARAMLALATLREIESHDLLAHVRRVGATFLAGLEDLADAHPSLVSEPRGQGFVLAFDLPSTAARDRFLALCLRRGVFASYTGTRSVRLRPHLVTSEADVSFALATFHDALREMA